MAVPDPDDPAARLVAAANFGAQRHPAWYHNLVADPHVTLDDRTQVTDYTAAELHGADRDRAFAHILRLNPGWTRFQTSAGSRGIPVVRLTRTHPEVH